MNRTYKVIEVVGVSDKSFAEATRNAVAQAAKTLKGLAWFETTQMRGLIKDGKVSEFQVAVKIGFRVLENP